LPFVKQKKIMIVFWWIYIQNWWFQFFDLWALDGPTPGLDVYNGNTYSHESSIFVTKHLYLIRLGEHEGRVFENYGSHMSTHGIDPDDDDFGNILLEGWGRERDGRLYNHYFFLIVFLSGKNKINRPENFRLRKNFYKTSKYKFQKIN
jgi:hypothetical protein